MDSPLALAHAGRGRGWWWPARPLVADDHRLWILGGSRTAVVALAGVDQVWRDARGIVAVAGARRVRVEGRGDEDARVWVADDFLYYTRGGRTLAVDALDRGEGWAAGPRGATLVGDGTGWLRAGAPGRSPQPLPRPLLPAPIRWSADGQRVAGLDEDERGAVVELSTGRVHEREGTPVSAEAWLVGDRIVRGGRTLRRGVTEASSARAGRWLAGPGGWLWDLERGRPVARRRVVALGWTGAGPDGFVTVDWETNRGWTVPYGQARRAAPFTLPVDPDDTVVAGVIADGAAHLRTALGEGLRVVGGRVERGDVSAVPDAGPERELPTAVGPFVARGAAEVGGRWWAWNDDGWLVYAPSPTNR